MTTCRRNSLRTAREWGLAQHDLEVLPGRAAESAGSSAVPTWLACATLSLVAAAETVIDFFIDGYVALRARLSAVGRSSPDRRLSGSASSRS